MDGSIHIENAKVRDIGYARNPAAVTDQILNNSPLLRVEDISLSFGGIRALDRVGFEVLPEQIVSIIGPNGAGKTSMANVISGLYRPTAGTLFFDQKDRTDLGPDAVAELGITRTFQNLALFRGLSVVDNVLMGRHRHMSSGLLACALHWGPARREELRHRAKVEEILEFLDLTQYRDTRVETLPFGLQKRVELARALAVDPILLLLDEPMAGMNHDEKRDMVRFIVEANVGMKTTIILIEHDMGVVMDISDWVIVLDHGEKIAEGSTTEISRNPRVIKAYLGEDV